MLVFSSQQLVFLAAPKTASTAIEQALGGLATIAIGSPTAVKHTGAGPFKDHFNPYLTSIFGHKFMSVALVREPRDWLGSWYRNRQREDEEQATSTQSVSFEEFVSLACKSSPPDFARIGTQSAFLNPRPDAKVDHIFKYDQLERFLSFLEDRLGFDIVLPRLNVSPMADLHLSGKTEDLFRKTFASDFDLYGSTAS